MVPLAAAPPDGAPPPCVRHSSDLLGYTGGAMVLCELASSQACSYVLADGSVGDAPVPPEYPSVALPGAVGSHATVTACATADACVSFTPKLETGESLLTASIDPTGALVVVGIRVEDSDDSVIEVWDAATGKRLDRSSSAGHLVDVDFVGDVIVVRADHGNLTEGVMWRVTGKKRRLDAGLPRLQGDPRDAAIVGPHHAAFAIGDEIVVHDTRTGKRLGAASWRGLVDEQAYQVSERDRDPWVQIAGEDDAVAVYVTDRGGPLLGAGVVTPLAGRDPQPFAIRLCPEA
jgi:hypothetical protein